MDMASSSQPMPIPEPMNASPHHSKVKVTIATADRLSIAGGKRLFQGPGLPPSNAVQARPAPGDPVLPPNYYQARRGLSTFLFRIPIPESSPSSINFGSGLAQVRYELRATVGVVWKDDRRLVVDKHALDVVAAYPFEEIVGLKSPEGVIIGENGKLWMHGKLVAPVVVAGESACIELHVKNHSNKKNTGLSLSLNRTLVLAGMSKLGKQALELTDTLTHVPFRGPEYIIPPGAEGVANLVFDVPKHSRGVRGGSLEGDEADPPHNTESLFEIRCTVDIKMSMGFGNKDLVLSVPVSIVHPKVIPPPQQLPMATGMGIMSPAVVPYSAPGVGAPYPYDVSYAPNPHSYANPAAAAYPALPMSSPPTSRPLPFLVDHQQNQAWIPPPPASIPTPMTPQPYLHHGYHPPVTDLLYQPHASPPRGQAYMAPPPIPPYLTRPSSAGGNVSLPDPYTLPVVQNVPGLPPPSTHDISQVQRAIPTSPPTSPGAANMNEVANTSLDMDAEEGKGQRALRVSHHLRLSSRTRSVSPRSHRYPIPPAAAPPPPPPPPAALDAHSPSGSAAVSPLRGVPRSPEGREGPVSPLGPIALSPSTRTINGSLSPAVPARRPGTATVVHSPRPQLTPKHSFSNDRPKSERVEELERMASVVALQATDLSGDIPKDEVLHAVSAALDSYQQEAQDKDNGKIEEVVKEDQIGGSGRSKDKGKKKKKKVGGEEEDGSPEVNKTLPAPPVPTRNKKGPSALSISPSSSRPQIESMFDPVSPARTAIGESSGPLPSNCAPRTPTLTALLPTRYPRTKLGNFLGVNTGGESGLDALERKLLAEVGTRKFDSRNGNGKKNDERPDIRDVLASFDGDDEDKGSVVGVNQGKVNGGGGAGRAAPIDIPVPIQSPDPANDSAISSLTLGNHEVEADPRPVEGAAGLGLHESERNGLGLLRVSSGGFDLGGGNDSDIEAKTHRGGSVSGDERVRSWNVSSIPLFDEEAKMTMKAGGRHRREEADTTNFRGSTPTKLSNESGKSGKDGKSKKKRDRAGKEERVKSRTEAKGRVAAWLGAIVPEQPPEEEVIPPSPSVARFPERILESLSQKNGETSPELQTQSVPVDASTETDKIHEEKDVSAAPNPRSSGFMPVSTLKRDPAQRPIARDMTVVEQSKEIADLWAAESSPSRDLVASSNDVATPRLLEFTPARAPPKSARTDRRVSPPSKREIETKQDKPDVLASLPPIAGARNVWQLPEPIATIKSGRKVAPVVPPKNLAAVRTPAQLPSAGNDPEVKYDVRSARGGRGGKVASVTAMWAAGISTAQSQSSSSKADVKPREMPRKLNHNGRFAADYSSQPSTKSGPHLPGKIALPGLASAQVGNGVKSREQPVPLPSPQVPPKHRPLLNRAKSSQRIEPAEDPREHPVTAVKLPIAAAAGGGITAGIKSTDASNNACPAPGLFAGNFKSRTPGKTTPTTNLSTPSSDSMANPRVNGGTGGLPTNTKPGLIKSTSVPAVISSSHAIPVLSSTASLARPAGRTSQPAPRFTAGVKLGISTTSSSDKVKVDQRALGSSVPSKLVVGDALHANSGPSSASLASPPPKSPPPELAFGQARLRDLIKKYQAQAG
ncbi:hypothetical protein MD484_g1976, partial [Candolleomyces efflorescens]